MITGQQHTCTKIKSDVTYFSIPKAMLQFPMFDGKNPAPLVMPETLFLGAKKLFSGIVSGAGFFPSTVCQE